MKAGHTGARAGEILVLPIEGRRPERFLFDAEKFRQTLSPMDLAEAAPRLQPSSPGNSRQRFFGLIEPVGLNAQAPAPAPVEAMRRGYLSPDVIVDLRHQAGGDLGKLNSLTARRFVDAAAAGDSATVGALLDPKPFTDASGDAAVWQGARSDFAGRLIRPARPGRARPTPTSIRTGKMPARGSSITVSTSLYRCASSPATRAVYVAAMEAL
ncbi:MAG: hypothetical protein WDN06_14430 [Asticcacaulis sp.]